MFTLASPCLFAATTRSILEHDAQRFNPVIASACHFDQGQFAFDIGADLGEIDHLVHGHQPFKLGVDLIDHLGRPVRDDGDPAQFVIIGDVGHGKAVNVIAARGEQSGDLGKYARFVVNGDG